MQKLNNTILYAQLAVVFFIMILISSLEYARYGRLFAIFILSFWLYAISFSYFINQNNQFINAILLTSVIPMLYLVCKASFNSTFDFIHLPTLFSSLHLLTTRKGFNIICFYVSSLIFIIWMNFPVYAPNNLLFTILFTINLVIFTLVISFKKFKESLKKCKS